ncbi:hypothetical protein PLICRDRAFT_114010 [Plicaturopsis crispa FD-325 SS-3]|nr:hypothetical protein PLICRDRAFT_114010 [Plicaturopsis crispa FD-325 SS-3]
MFSYSCPLVVLLALPYLSYALPHPARLYQRIESRGFDIPIQRQVDHAKASIQRRTGASGSVNLGDNSDILYTVPITLGGTTTSVNLDTGSSDLWVVSDACKTSLCQKSNVTPYPTSSFVSSNASVTLNYGDSTTGTFAIGPIGTDTASIAGMSMSGQQFGAIDNTTNPTITYGAAGIFGLGFPSESVIQSNVVNQQFNNPSTTDNFLSTIDKNGPLLSRMAQSGALDQPMFSITLQRDTIDIGGNGALTIGKLPDGVDNSSLTWVPVRRYSAADGGIKPPSFAPDEVGHSRWEVELDAVYLDGKKLADSTIPGTGGVDATKVSALIDTGNSIVRGPSDVIQSILSAVSSSFAAASARNPNAVATLPCTASHSLAFEIGGQMFPVDPRDFVSENKAGDATTCVANNVIGTDPPSVGALYSWSLGDPFFKSNLVAFYYGNLTHPSVDPPRIGFMSTVPTNATALLDDAVQEAQQNGGSLECT